MCVSLGKLITQAERFAAMRKPTVRDQENVLNYMENEGIVAGGDGEWAYMRDDLVALKGVEDPWLDEWVSDALGSRLLKPLRVSE